MVSKYGQQLEIWKQKRAKVLERQESGVSINDLAKEMGVSVSQINSFIKKAKRDRLK